MSFSTTPKSSGPSLSRGESFNTAFGAPARNVTSATDRSPKMGSRNSDSGTPFVKESGKVGDKKDAAAWENHKSHNAKLLRAWPGGSCTKETLISAFTHMPLQPTLEQMHYIWHKRSQDAPSEQRVQTQDKPDCRVVTTAAFADMYEELRAIVHGLALIKRREVDGVFQKLDIRKCGTITVTDVMSLYTFGEREMVMNQVCMYVL
jgi:hypothetical protein